MLLEKHGNTSTSCNAHPCPVCFGIGVTSPCTEIPSQLLCLLCSYRASHPAQQHLISGNWKGKGKKQGSGHVWTEGWKGDRIRHEASCCLKSSTVKSQTVQDIDNIHIDVLSVNFQLVYNHFSSGGKRNPVL